MKKNNLIPFEKSKRVIHLEQRGNAKKKAPVSAKIFAFLGVLCLLYCLLILFFMGYGTTFFLIWGAIAVACGVLSLLLAHKAWLKRIPKWCKVSFVSCCAIGGLLFGIVEAMILSEFAAAPQPGADYVLILGAQWKESGPSYVLQKRLDAALDYLRNNPETLVIVSGGQGSNEPISEAAGMESYLLEAGIAKERILLEDKSTNTCENLVFSEKLLDKSNDRVVLITNNFHMFRASRIAKKQGYVYVEGLAAGSYPGMLPNNLLREFFGVVKDFCVGNL
ncbi:MAG: YdcF family protein [Lachnospiraceae bacterium]|nr:YdcF family protein [Lachnospiraceae bacterium]